MSGKESWEKTIGLIRKRYVDAATTLTTLRESGGVVTVKVTGGLLEMNEVPEIECEITMTVPAHYVPHLHTTTKMFLSNVYEKVYGEANPLSWTAKELQQDFKITTCDISKNNHIQSDTFFGLRVEFTIVDPVTELGSVVAVQDPSSIYYIAVVSSVASSSSSSSSSSSASSAAVQLRSDLSWQTMLRTEASALKALSDARFASAQALMFAANN